MKTVSLPVLVATAAALAALPFNFAAASLLALTAALGAIIRADYSHRYRGLPLPRRPKGESRFATVTFRAPPLGTEQNRLAA
jgi:hypothetical protein